jgi:hypothetical protein
LNKNVPVELQNYLSGKIDLNTFMANTEKMIKDIDKSIK